MKKVAAGLIAAALVCTALPVYAAEDTEMSGIETADSETEDSSLLSDSLYLEESEAGEDLSDLTGWSISDEQAQVPMTLAASSSGNVVVVLDPGHDSTHTGASYGGLREETLNLKIAEYCKEELEEYGGVTVYMTRTTAACPFPGDSNSDDLAGRVNYAASVGATVYVSLHLNANTNTEASGAQVYCPNSNYNASISTEGFALANSIMAQLNTLGLSNRGVYSVNSQSGTTYPDGSLADYYAVIRRSKLAGFPGIIVEHAFMSNTSDLNTYLSSDESLKKLGVADATGIANYFNLSKGSVALVDGVWTYVVDGVPDYTYTGIAHNSNGWWYVKNGVVDFNYDGFAENSNGKWYCENGKVNFDVNGVIKDTTGAIGPAGTWYYVVGSKVQTDYTGVADYENEDGWWYIKDGVVDFTANTVARNSYGWWYVKDGKVDFSYTGFAENSNGKWYCENGKVNFDVTGLIKDTTGAIGTKDAVYYVINSEVQTDYTGVTDFEYENEWWYIKNGVVDETANTVARNSYGWWYVKNGKVDFSYTGFAENSNGKWYCENGKVNFNVNGFIADTAGAIGAKDAVYYVVNSEAKTDYTGVADFEYENEWWYIKNGVVDETANTVARNSYGWWYVKDGKVDFSYNGFAENSNGKWYCENGKVHFNVTGLIKDTTGAIGAKDTLYYVINSEVQTSYTGVADFESENEWWYIKNGVVDKTANTVARNKNGWWYVTGGKVQFGFTGLANYSNENGWWYIKNGKVDFTANTVAKNKNGWWYVTGGKVQFGYTGLANYANANGWWYIKNGKVDFTHTGVDKNKNGWWYVKSGKVDFSYNGLAKNSYGWWYIRSGAVNFAYSGTIRVSGNTYQIKNGKVV